MGLRYGLIDKAFGAGLSRTWASLSSESVMFGGECNRSTDVFPDEHSGEGVGGSCKL